MKSFTTHTGIIAVLDRSNIDTDQIIPKQFLKSIKRTGFGPSLFFDSRYNADGSLNPDFDLNKPQYRGASILVTGANFGCGSSREHAVWAVQQYGFSVVIAPSFADIFKNNSTKNGLLLIELPEATVNEIMSCMAGFSDAMEAAVDLPNQVITFACSPPRIFPFFIDPATKDFLIKGLDEIGQTFLNEREIEAYERRAINF
ncbi:3-isopropylmalate dehydratase small subunit [Candidatus Gracilibacteria bacterium]|nr:3-isopropylmalate dehydratase small subunit [Candidatus Gracilibacteria bacterium]